MEIAGTEWVSLFLLYVVTVWPCTGRFAILGSSFCKRSVDLCLWFLTARMDSLYSGYEAKNGEPCEINASEITHSQLPTYLEVLVGEGIPLNHLCHSVFYRTLKEIF